MAYFPPFVPTGTDATISIENNGVWQAGGTYQVQSYIYLWDIHSSNSASGERENYISKATPHYIKPDDPLFSLLSPNPRGLFFSDVVANNYGSTLPFTTWFNDSYTDYRNDVSDTITRTHVNIVVEEVSGGGGNLDRLRWYETTDTWTIPLNEVTATYTLAYLSTLWAPSGSGQFSEELGREYWQISITGGGVSNPTPDFPEPRPVGYDPDTVWDPILGDWVAPSALTTAGGGRYNKQIVVIGHKQLYYGDI